MNKLILHIPHSSTNIPFKDGFIIGDELINSEILKLTDWYTDDLFDSENSIKVVADFSRIFCDVERFENDEQEIMAQFGMGAIYTKTDAGKIMRVISDDLRNRILQDYYRKHHKILFYSVENQLNEFACALIIDCHSFSDFPFLRDLNQNTTRPDICIGTDDFHTPKELLDLTYEFFKYFNLTVALNNPYSGTIVPIEYYGQNKNVQSIMIEINRKLYLKDGTNKKSKNYKEIKLLIKNYFNEVNFFSSLNNDIQI